MKRCLSFFSLGVLLSGVLLLGTPGHAWWPKGHGILTEAAVLSLPEEMPPFFRAGGKAVAHYSYDPDVLKNRSAPLATNAEYSEHYMDWELLLLPPAERTLPPNRYEFLKYCYARNLDPTNVGLLPYAVAEWTERLAIAFAEHRRWPNNERIKEKCFIYAGFVAHYAEDLCQPLHVTVHHDGRVPPSGVSPRSGIHAKVDGLIEKVGLLPQELAKQQKIEPLPTLLPEIITQIHESRSYVDRAYELEFLLPSADAKVTDVDPRVLEFATTRARESTRFTASLFLTAWRHSASVKLPTWLEREQ